MKKIRYASLFSGIEAPLQGIYRVYGKDNVEHIFACEWDKFARQSLEANYDMPKGHFYKDVHDMCAKQYLGKVDIFCAGSPCQAFSIAGMRHGTADERGQLIYQYIRVVDECKPEIIIYENVRGMMSIGNGKTIKEFVQALRDIGYHCHYGVVNTKDYGVPQNRERLFLVGFKDVDLYHKFHFADKQKLTKRLEDVLEEDVDEKYYLNIELDTSYKSQCAGTHGYAQGYIQVKSATKQGYEIATTGDSINLSVPNSKTRRGRVGKQVAQCLDCKQYQAVVEPKIEIRGSLQANAGVMYDCCTALTSAMGMGGGQVPIVNRIRKLTPRECFRLQDFPDDFKFVVSNSQLYRQAGNSMSVNILEMIFNQIEKAKRGESIGLF